MCQIEDKYIGLVKEALNILKFYADETNWERPLNQFSNATMDSNAMLDGGHLARAGMALVQEGLKVLREAATAENKPS